MPPKIIFFDIDDPLFRKWQDFMPAFRALHEAGVLTAIATGRSSCALPAKIQALIDVVGLDVLVSINGQYNRYRGETIASPPSTPPTRNLHHAPRNPVPQKIRSRHHAARTCRF